MKIVLVSNIGEIRDVLSRGIGEGAKWISLSPLASYNLEKLGIEYSVCDDYFDVAQLRALSKEAFLKVKDIARVGDDYLHQNVSGLKDKGILPFHYRLYHMFRVYSGTVARIMQLLKIFQSYPGSEIITYTSREYEFGVYGFLFNKNERVWGRLLEMSGWDRRDVRIKLLPEVNRSTIWKRTSNYNRTGRFFYDAFEALSRKFRWLDILRALNARGPDSGNVLSVLFRVFASKFKKEKNRVLFLRPYYGWKSVFSLFLRKGVRVSFFPEDISGSEDVRMAERLLGGLERDPVFERYFVNGGISFYWILRSRLLKIINEAISYPGLYRRAARIFAEKKTQCVLTSSGVKPLNFLLCRLAKNMGIPAIVWQHGIAAHFDENLTPYMDFFEANHYFTFGVGVSERFRDDCIEHDCLPIAVGSAPLDNISAQADHIKAASKKRYKKKTLLYITTNYMENNWYGVYVPPFSDNKLYLTQRGIMKDLCRLSGVNIVVKMHGNPEYPEPPWKEEYRNNKDVVFIKNEVPVNQLLAGADAVYIDWPSTTLLEALSAKKCVFQLTDLLSLDRSALGLLEKRAVCGGRKLLFEKTREFIEKGSYDRDIENTEFLNAYGRHLDDLKSAERAVDTVLDLISRNPMRLNGRSKKVGDKKPNTGYVLQRQTLRRGL